MANNNRKRLSLRTFAQHRVAANLLMVIMIIAGLWSLTRINTQFLPTFSTNLITVTIVWPGANAKDVERSVVLPIEEGLRSLEDVKKMSSVSKLGSAVITLEMFQGTNMAIALDDVKQEVSQVRNLPPDSEPPIIKEASRLEPVADILLTGASLNELRPLAYQFERQLLDRGIAKVAINGLPDQEIAVQISTQKLNELQLSLVQIARLIANQSMDIPAGSIGKGQISSELRSNNQRRSIAQFTQMPLIHDAEGQLIRLGDIAQISLRPRENSVLVFHQGKPAINLGLQRTESANALKSAKIFHDWLQQARKNLPQGVHILVFNETWQLIKERIDLLIHNGLAGLALIVVLLFLILNMRVAFWIAVGIPVSLLAALAVFYLLGGSINMVSLFAIIMTLGIIVDDTIVVGEETLTQLNNGHSSLEAAVIGAKKMFVPVMASSLTTVCVFIPLLLVTDVIGTILRTIPIIVICAIIASLLEAFFVLPGHLHHGFAKNTERKLTPSPWKKRINAGFENFRQHKFRRFTEFSIRHRWTTLSIAVALFILALTTIISGRLNFTFFPSPEGTQIAAEVQFRAGTSPAEKDVFLHELEQSLAQTDKTLSAKNGKQIVIASASFQNQSGIRERKTGEQHMMVAAELTSPDSRKISNQTFINAWRKNTQVPVTVESFVVTSPQAGPPGRDIDIEISGNDINNLKAAAIKTANALGQFRGVSNIKDNLPYGKQHIVFDLNAQGRALEFTTDSIGQQLRAAFQGQIAQIYYQTNDEIEVRVMLPDEERYSLASLNSLQLATGGGELVPFASIANLSYERSFDELNHINTQLTTQVTADVDEHIANANKILNTLNETILPEIQKQFFVTMRFAGRSEEQSQTLEDMRYGMVIGLVLIYIILAWVFSSYGWPLLIMAAIPLGLTGAIFGHLIMGLDLTVLSLFGFFGLSGIVINDSIILINRYQQLIIDGMSRREAIVEAIVQRFRAVILTSLTTAIGLMPLLLETSLQAQFLIPMATSISFGILYATFLILFVIPCLLSIYEDLREKYYGWRKARSVAA